MVANTDPDGAKEDGGRSRAAEAYQVGARADRLGL